MCTEGSPQLCSGGTDISVVLCYQISNPLLYSSRLLSVKTGVANETGEIIYSLQLQSAVIGSKSTEYAVVL